ncbi:MAG: hypothetical protein O2800_00745 [Planctomycetota bacterium]|nr:hypothetical protein [Planctomycetota bacterium]
MLVPTLSSILSVVLAVPPSIEHVAPKDAVAVLWWSDVAATFDRLAAASVGTVLNDERLKESMGPVIEAWKSRQKELGQGDETMTQEVGMPGALGAALFVERDAELDADRLAFMAYLDYGTRSEKAWTLLTEELKRTAKESNWVVAEEEIDGRPALVVTFPNPEDAPEFDEGPAAMLGQMLAPMESLVLTRTGDTIVAGSAVHVVESCLEALAGKPAGAVLESAAGWRDASGAHPAGDFLLVVMTDPLSKIAQPLMAGPAAGMQEILQTLIGDVTTWSLWGSTSDPTAQIRLRGAATYPTGPKGLFKLVQGDGATLDASRAMGDDCFSYTSFNFDFGGLPRLIEELLAAMPEAAADQVEPMIRAYMPALNKAFGAMGPRIEQVSRADALAEAGYTSLTRIACRDEQSVLPLIQLWGPMMGLEPMEFQGSQVFGGADSPFAVGLGPTGMYLGDRTGVESGLRASVAADSASLSATVLFKRCAEAAGPGSMSAFGYSDIVASMEAARTGLASQEAMFDALGGMEDLPGDETVKAINDAMAKIDLKVLREHVGPIVWTLHGSYQAMVFDWKFLAP